jgi:hypothetical protein
MDFMGFQRTSFQGILRELEEVVFKVMLRDLEGLVFKGISMILKE